MAYDGSGTYSPPTPEYPAIPDTVISSDDYNAILEDIADALSSVILRNGVAAFTGNQSLGGFKLTNNANGSADTDLPTMAQVFTNPTFNGTDADGVTITGTKLTVDTTDISLEASGDLTIAVTDDITISGDAIAITATSLTLPSGTTIGSLSTAELGYLDGVTSNIQTQLDAKAPIASPTFTGEPRAPTPTTNDNSTKVATTAFVAGQFAVAASVPNYLLFSMGVY